MNQNKGINPKPICSECGQHCNINSIFDVDHGQMMWCYCTSCEVDTFYKLQKKMKTMYDTLEWEKALKDAEYTLLEMKRNYRGLVCRVVGLVKRNATTNKLRKVHWDATGHCFDRKTNVRLRQYDLKTLKLTENKEEYA